MRRFAIAIGVLAVAPSARADDGGGAAVVRASAPSADADSISAGAAIGAGGQGDDSYLAAEVRMDATWDGGKLGLGARGVWIGGAFRSSDWSRPADAVNVLRYLEASTTFDRERGADADGDGDSDGHAAIAAGGLAPAHLAQLADGYRVQLDDLLHTGVRVAVSDGRVEVGAEIDDVLDPALIGGRVRVGIDRAWGVNVAAVIDPSAPTASVASGTAGVDGTRVASAIEVGASRRFVGDGARAELGAGFVGEPTLGASAVGFGSAAIELAGVRFSAAGDLRAGTGTVGAAFGPLYRIERLAHAGELALDDRARMGELDGVGAGLSLGAIAPAGWLEVGMRARPGLASLATLYGGGPMGAHVQAGAWLAASRTDAAGTAEVRVAWNRRLFSAIDAARLYRLDPMDPIAVWSVVAWLGASAN